MGKGKNLYEKGNHLGNVLVTVSDKKIAVDSDNDGIVNYYTADVVTANDYYPGGMTMPGRKFTQANSTYRYGFNGKEQDKEMAGTSTYDYGFRIYNPALGRFLSVDPLYKSFPFYTPYQYAGNKPVWCIDMDGLEDIPATSTGVVQPFSTAQLIKWAKDDGFYLGPKSRGETVILIQDYRVVGNPQPIHKEFVLFKGAINKSISIITQDNVTFRQDGTTGTSAGPEMRTRTIKFGSPEFALQINKAYPEGISPDDFGINFAPKSRKLTDEKTVTDKLKPVADYLKTYPKAKINISGNTDASNLNECIISDGEDISIQQLKDGRAKTLIKVLTDKLNVNSSQIDTTEGTQGVNRNGNVKLVEPPAPSPTKKD